MIKEILAKTLLLLCENKELRKKIRYLEGKIVQLATQLHGFSKPVAERLYRGEIGELHEVSYALIDDGVVRCAWCKTPISVIDDLEKHLIQCFQDAEEGKTSGRKNCPKEKSSKGASEKNF